VTYRKHLIGLVKNEHLHGIGFQVTALNHILDTARSSDNDLGTFSESLHVISDTGSTNACVALDANEVTEGDNNLLNLLSQLASRGKNQCLAGLDVGINLLKNRNGESGSLSGSRLSLSDDIGTWAVC